VRSDQFLTQWRVAIILRSNRVQLKLPSWVYQVGVPG
jgi:hypothetical protein